MKTLTRIVTTASLLAFYSSSAMAAITGISGTASNASVLLDKPAESSWFVTHTPERVVLDIDAKLAAGFSCPAHVKSEAFARVYCYSQQERTLVMFEAVDKAAAYEINKKDGMITVNLKTQDKRDLKQAEAAQQKSPVQKKYTGKKMSLQFSDVDIRRVFQLISEVSGFNFLIADDVTGSITMKLTGVPWDQALDTLLDSKDLGMVKDGGIIQIKPKAKIKLMADEDLAIQKSQEKALPLRTRIFTINFAALTDIVAQFTAVKSERGAVTKDDRTNKIIVADIQSAIDKMEQLVGELDTPDTQVMIEARIVEASTAFTRDIGMSWGMHYNNPLAPNGINSFHSTMGGVTSSAASTGAGGPGGAIGVSFGKLGAGVNLDMRLSAAVGAGTVKIISRPSVLTLNNKPAKISQGQQIPYTSSTSDKVETKFIEAALVLEATPRISPDGMITLKVKASNDSPGQGSPPSINTKVATTEVIVADGETVVIGGISADNDVKSDSGVPWLKDLPIIGHLFSSQQANRAQNELIIFITPRIVPMATRRVPVN